MKKSMLFVFILICINNIYCEDVIFNNLSGEKYILNKTNCKFEAVDLLKTVFISLNSKEFVLNESTLEWIPKEGIKRQNYLCNNDSEFQALLRKLNIQSNELELIDNVTSSKEDHYTSKNNIKNIGIIRVIKK